MSNQKATYSALLGQVFSVLRKSKGIEQGDMAQRMGMSQASYSRLESGKAVFTFDQMFQASDALNVTPESVLERLNTFKSELEEGGIDVEPQVRSSTAKGAEVKKSDEEQLTTFIAGAALGALIFGLLSDK